MILYHGTKLEFAMSILQEIKVEINLENELDFGYGFYMGDIRYASRTAVLKAKASNLEGKASIPAVIECDVDLDAIKEVFNDGLIFKIKTKKCLDLIFNCRYHKGEKILNNSYIIAPLADGSVDAVMGWYKANPSIFRKIITYFNYWIPIPHRQLVVKNPEVCKYITITKITNEKGDVLWEKN